MQKITWTERTTVETGETFSDAFTGLEVRETRVEEREMTGTLTTEHAASSYGQPVLVVDGIAYGPLDVVAGTSDRAGAIVNTARTIGAADLAAKFVRAGALAL